MAVPVWTTVTLGPHSALDPRVSPERVDVDEAGGINGLVVSLYVHAAKREEAVSTPRPGLVIQARTTQAPPMPPESPQIHPTTSFRLSTPGGTLRLEICPRARFHLDSLGEGHTDPSFHVDAPKSQPLSSWGCLLIAASS